MKQNLRFFFLMLAASALAYAHFVFVVPNGDGATATVLMSEILEPDAGIDPSMFAGTKLKLRAADGTESPLTLTQREKVFSVALSGKGTRVVHGITDFGVMQRGKAHVLLYYPKTIVGDAFDPKAVVNDAPVELVPEGKPGALRLKLLARGKPVEKSEILVILPDGNQKKMTTDSNGLTEVLTQTGRYGAWARFWESTPGERDGKKYEELRHYATLVFDAWQPARAFATMPQATSSFGLVETGGWLYVYGGHISPTHTYWDEAVSGKFNRLNLATGKWEELASGPALQGLNLAAHQGKIYRIGGMAPRNKRGKAADNRSTSECARFDPSTGQWEALPPLPQARSSHDVVVIGNQLIVAGGWDMEGPAQEWMDSVAVLDLSASPLAWKTVPQPFRRRALIAAAWQNKLYVIGGFDDKNQIVSKVSIYDPATGAWSEGPALPGGGRAFAPAAAVHQRHLYVSISDGTLLRLDESRQTWEKVGTATGRVAHRLASSGDAVLVAGGASAGRNFDLVEAIEVAR